MEQTQLLEWDGEGDSTDGSDAAARETPKAVGRLHLLSSKYGPEKDFWIYPGENTIGRLESCHVCLPANSVSKTHAVIEVPSSHGPHLLYDQGSLNRTRRQRMNLVPQVRYSLQDGDTLLFGDVGCQYFILVPDTDYDSHDDSMAVPPTQGRVEASALAIEETPAPGRRIGFGQVLVQDSDKEEEGEEVMNGTGSYLHHTSKDESDCSNKNGSGEGQASLASFGVSSPSATVVPESDDETGDPSVDGPLCPALRLSFESQEAERSPAENGGSPSSNREDRGESTAAEHGLVEGFRLDSDTDVEDENQMGGISEAPASLDPEKRDRGPEVDPDTDLNESSVVAPVVRCPQTSMELGSDTDAEETVESPAVFRLKLPSTSMEKEEDDTDVEAEVENPSVVCPGKHEPVPPKEGDCKQLEDNVDNVQLGGKKDEDTDVEEDLDNPESSVNALPPTAHEDVDTDVEDSSVKGKTLSRTKNRVVGGHSDSEDVDTDVEDSSAKGKTLSRTKNRVVGGHSDSEDVDTDVEDSSAKGKTLSRTKNRVVGGHSNGDDTKEEAIKPQLENSEDTSPQRTCSSSGKESSTDMKDVPLKRIIPAGHSVGERHGDVVGLTKNPNVELEMSYAVGDQSPRDFDKKEISSNAMQHNLPMLLLGSDTDGEEEAGNPDVESMKSQHISGAEPSKGSRVSRLGDPDIGSLEKPSPGQDKDSDTDAEVTSMGRDKSTAQDSDTDAEDVAPSLLRKPLEEKSAQIIIPGRSQAGGEHSSTVGIGVSFKSREDNEDKDAEREESYSADESNTDDELDVSLQATQCYLPTATIPSGPEKAGGIPATVSDSDCALEEEPTQAFDFSPPFLPTKRQFRNVTSSPLKDNSSDQEDDMLEATQPYCEEPQQVSAEPCDKKKLDPERIVQNQPEGDKCFEQVPQPDFPAATSPGKESTSSLSGDNPPPQAVELPAMQSPLQTSEGAPEEETQPLGSVQIPLVVSKGSFTSQEEKREEVPESGSPSSEVVVPRQSEATPVDDRVEENSELVRKTKNSKKVLVPAQEDPASATTPARELRRSLRSSTTSASPTPVPERRSLRCHGSGAVVASSTPAAPESRRRGLRQLSNASQQMREVKERPEQPGEEGPRKKARNGDLNAAPVPQGRTRGTQRASRAASKVTEVAKAISGSSPGAREPTKRVRRAPAPNPRLEGQTEHPRTRASKHSSSSSSTSVSTPSPKDSGKGAKLGQELVFTPSSGRRLRRHSPESKATSQKASSGSRTRRTTGSGSPAPKVLFTGVIDEEGERIVAELGGTLAESVFDCTHLVTDRVRRTVKFLCALARGIPIVTLDWLEKSRRNAFFLAPNNFLVRDPEQEENLRFSLSNSLQKAQQKGALFQGYEIHVTPNVKPEPEHMKDIVKCSGGTLLPRMPRAFKEKRIVVSCPEDLSRCKPAQEARVPITNAEFILTGILQQTVDLEAHRLHGSVGLSPASSPLVPSTRTSKRRAATQTAPAPPSTAKRRR
ncbi:mediator of DNA damage checkpoint protein 1 isoform X1 [Pantherophis guttatus]|uniref:Mediator of DNA damage checkpoint protein 1 n=1 Tax=Pantherophis guttatus TaxID=94885 RepID=A0A6P9CDR8_PANGU|nr:mediator of DNA damage checkpoint protein 1 isoform X1 [Pantherophis guttatus]XP_060546931.1 mediator of DNA damage checkpoint protein 1 isoform X1 [Pantherophis guttatus]